MSSAAKKRYEKRQQERLKKKKIADKQIDIMNKYDEYKQRQIDFKDYSSLMNYIHWCELFTNIECRNKINSMPNLNPENIDFNREELSKEKDKYYKYWLATIGIGDKIQSAPPGGMIII